MHNPDSRPGEGRRSGFTLWGRSAQKHTGHKRMAVTFKKN